MAESTSTNSDKIDPSKKACPPPRDIPTTKMNYTMSLWSDLILALAR